jgi:hypothetical protein
LLNFSLRFVPAHQPCLTTPGLYARESSVNKLN